MPKKNLSKTEESNPQLSKFTEASLLQWAINMGYKNPLIYSSDKCKCILIMDMEADLLTVTSKDEATQIEIETTINIASTIRSLPSDELQELAHTDDLKKEFNIQRNDCSMIGTSFIFANLHIEGDPLETEKQKGMVNQWTEEVINQTAYYYRALLELLTVAFKDIKKAFPDMSFTNPEQLLCKIIKDHRNSQFKSIATSKFKVILTEELVHFWQGIKSGKSHEELEKRCIIKSLGSVHQGEWLHKCLEFLEEKAKKNKKIHGRLKIYYTECDLLADAIAESCKARDSKGKIKKSIQWKKGEGSVYDNRNRPTIPLSGYKT